MIPAKVLAAGKVSRKPGNSQALDQYRGLALILVLISHGFYFTGEVNGVGRVGVNLFFFISGILVFRSLTTSKNGPDLTFGVAVSFLKRRIMRLFPAMMVYLAAVAPIVYLFAGFPHLPPRSDFLSFLHTLPFGVLFLVDYIREAPPSMGHLWSVSVEMQFYIVAPLILFIGGRGNRRRVIVWTMLLAALMLLGMIELARGYQERYQFQFVVWPMMLGFLLESQKHRLAHLRDAVLAKFVRLGWVMILFILFLMFFSHEKAIIIAGGALIVLPCYLSYIAGQSIPGPVGRTLSWLGERTYSIYLWQQPFTLCGYAPTAYEPLGALIAIGVGAISYRFAERPFLSSKRLHATGESVAGVLVRGIS